MSQSDPVLKVVALCILLMEKNMSAEIDRLNTAVTDLGAMVSDVSGKVDVTAATVADLKAQIAAGVTGIDPMTVDAAASTLEGFKPVLQGVIDKLNAL